LDQFLHPCWPCTRWRWDCHIKLRSALGSTRFYFSSWCRVLY